MQTLTGTANLARQLPGLTTCAACRCDDETDGRETLETVDVRGSAPMREVDRACQACSTVYTVGALSYPDGRTLLVRIAQPDRPPGLFERLRDAGAPVAETLCTVLNNQTGVVSVADVSADVRSDIQSAIPDEQQAAI